MSHISAQAVRRPHESGFSQLGRITPAAHLAPVGPFRLHPIPMMETELRRFANRPTHAVAGVTHCFLLNPGTSGFLGYLALDTDLRGPWGTVCVMG